jgi:hypothetical protein
MANAGGFALEGEWTDDRELRIPVMSSFIEEISFRAGTITVRMSRGGAGSYDYPGSFELFKRFANAPSAGAFFNAYIKPLL